MPNPNLLNGIKINKEETSTFIKYTLNDEKNPAQNRSNELVITSHGIYSSRSQIYTYNKVIAFYTNHSYILQSGTDSVLRRVLQGGAIAREACPIFSSIVNYNLSNISTLRRKYANVEMERKDYIKAILFESYLYQLKNVYQIQREKLRLNLNSNLIISNVPDILMVKANTTLNEVLNDPKNMHYKKVFASFCRGNRHSNAAMIPIEVNDVLSTIEKKEIEQIVISELKNRGIINILGTPIHKAAPPPIRPTFVAAPPLVPVAPKPPIPPRTPSPIATPPPTRNPTLASGETFRKNAAPIPATTFGKNYSNRDLRHFDFSNQDLTNANFMGANLTNANFTRSNLTSVNFSRANLTGCNFTEATLCWGKFELTKIYHTNFWDSNLEHTDLNNALYNNDYFSEDDIVKNTNAAELCTKAKKWESKGYNPLKDSKELAFNVFIPKIMKLEEIIKSDVYRFVILQNGTIFLGYEDNRKQAMVFNPTNARIENKVTNFTAAEGIEIASHGGLCNYQRVVCAGIMQVVIYLGKRIILSINNCSGHYRPDDKSLFAGGIIIKKRYPDMCKNTKIYSLRMDHFGRQTLVQIGTIV